MRRVTATTAARNLSDLLNRVRYRGESFTILRGGEEVGRLVPPELPAAPTLRTVFEALDALLSPDPGFAVDLREIQEEQPPLPSPPWES